MEPGSILPSRDRAFWVGVEGGAGQPIGDFSSGDEEEANAPEGGVHAQNQRSFAAAV